MVTVNLKGPKVFKAKDIEGVARWISLNEIEENDFNLNIARYVQKPLEEETITVEEALFAYTKDAAYASFEEDIKGTLEVGKLADFVILNEDITLTESVKIKDLVVLETYVGGKKVYEIE